MRAFDIFASLIGLLVLVATVYVINWNYVGSLLGRVMETEIGLVAMFVGTVLLLVLAFIAWTASRRARKLSQPATAIPFFNSVFKES